MAPDQGPVAAGAPSPGLAPPPVPPQSAPPRPDSGSTSDESQQDEVAADNDDVLEHLADIEGAEEAVELPILEVVELEVQELPDEDDEDEDGSVDEGSDLFNKLYRRLRADGLDQAEAETLADAMVGVCERRAEWEQDAEAQEKAADAYNAILADFDKEKQALIEAGIEVKIGPTPPNNPITAFILDHLYWPHEDVSLELGYIDKGIATFRNLENYGFFEPIRSGTASVLETHSCQAHASSADSPTFPRNGVFSCSQAVQDLVHDFSRKVYSTRLELQIPGFVWGYGAFNKKYLAALRDASPMISCETFNRLVQPLKRDSAIVKARSFPCTILSHAEGPESVFSVEWDVDHPSACGYAGSRGGIDGALAGRSYALTLDRALEEKVLLARFPPPQKSHYFQKMAFVIYDTLLQCGESGSATLATAIGADWGRKVNNAYRDEQRERERIADDDRAASQIWTGWTKPELVRKLDNAGLAGSICKWANIYDERKEEFSGIPAFHRVPLARSLLEKALWAVRWDARLKRERERPMYGSEGAQAVHAMTPLGIPLAVQGEIAIRRDSEMARLAPRPIILASRSSFPAQAMTPVGIPLAAVGTTTEGRRTVEVRNVAHPLNPHDGSTAFDVMTPFSTLGIPLAMTGEKSRALLLHRHDSNGLPMNAQEGGSVICRMTPAGPPLGSTPREKWYLGEDCAWPIPGTSIGNPLLRMTPLGAPVSQDAATVRQSLAFATGDDSTRPILPGEGSRVTFALTPLGIAPSQRGSSAYGQLRNDRDETKSRPEHAQEGGTVLLTMTPVAPIAVTARTGATEVNQTNRNVGRPIPAAEGPSVLLVSSYIGAPTALAGNRKSGREKGAGETNAASYTKMVSAQQMPRPIGAAEGANVLIASTYFGVPVTVRGRKKGKGDGRGEGKASKSGSGRGGSARGAARGGGRGRGRGRGGSTGAGAGAGAGPAPRSRQQDQDDDDAEEEEEEEEEEEDARPRKRRRTLDPESEDDELDAEDDDDDEVDQLDED